jgi:hypothetical protein
MANMRHGHNHRILQPMKVSIEEAKELMNKKKQNKISKMIDPILVCTFKDGYRDTKNKLRVVVDRHKQMTWERIQSTDALGVENWVSTNVGAVPRNLKLSDWQKLKEICDKMIPICEQEHIIEGISRDCVVQGPDDNDDDYNEEEEGDDDPLLDII